MSLPWPTLEKGMRSLRTAPESEICRALAWARAASAESDYAGIRESCAAYATLLEALLIYRRLEVPPHPVVTP